MKIGIFGRSKILDKSIEEKAKEIGKILASLNYTIVTGGSLGYPHIVALSALEHGATVIAYAVGLNLEDHKNYHNIDLSKYSKIVFQKEYLNKKLSSLDNYYRSLRLCSFIDAAIVIGGRVGTLYEVTIMSGSSKNVFILENTGDITNNTLKSFILEGHKSDAKMLFFKQPGRLSFLFKDINH